jgi:transcription termination/antitermination protein NusG
MLPGDGVSSGSIEVSSPPTPEARTAAQWFVLHTKSRQEKALAQSLDAMSVGYFLPVIEQVRRDRGRKIVTSVPLFPGYLFLHGSNEQAYEADRTRRIAQIIPVSDQQRLESDIRNIRLALSCRAKLEPFPFMKRGTRVEVRSGPFRGLQGIVEDHAGAGRLILQVDVIGKATSLEIDGAVLEPVR